MLKRNFIILISVLISLGIVHSPVFSIGSNPNDTFKLSFLKDKSSKAEASSVKSEEEKEKDRLEEEPLGESNQDKKSVGLSQGEAEALVLYNKGVELFQIGQIQSEKGNRTGQKDLLKQAIYNFKEALENNPELIEAQSNIGFAYLTLEQRGQAVNAFRKALKINPNHLKSLNGLATAYALQKKIKKALDPLNKLTELDPGNPEYFFNKGSVLQKAGKFEDAQQAYEEAIRIEPEYQRALFNLATLFENEGKLAEAVPYYEKAKTVDISNPIGLECIHRINRIETYLSDLKSTDENQAQKETENEKTLKDNN